jgi:hydroxymethylglutaryl-CoA reductase (NADPH)
VSDRLPRFDADHTADAAAARRAFLRERTGVDLEQVGGTSIDPAQFEGNVEAYVGTAQVPLGVAGPLLVDGEHAHGEFYVPMATTEGTLVASYNRGMKLLRAAGGVRTTIVQDRMQRAPVFVFEDARRAREFGAWLESVFDDLVAAAATTTSSGVLRDVQQFGLGPMRYCRFNYTTGDAAGQNMTGKATAAACAWAVQHSPVPVAHFQLEGGLATDKKASQMNMLHTRGKRVVAEALIPSALVEEQMRVTAAQLFRARLIGMAGANLAGANNNGAHSANGITALFIACGQDVANVAEASTAYVFGELRGDAYYYSITIPSLIVATYGGGTRQGTARECLQLLGCDGAGHVGKFAEIVAATVLCGELSLGSAVVADEWVSSHDRLGRNR